MNTMKTTIRITIENTKANELGKALDDKNIKYKTYKNIRKNDNQTRFYISLEDSKLLEIISYLPK